MAPRISRAHPRSRGEHSVVCKSPWTSKGSSPLARGTPVLGGSTETVPGLIPARAGNTWELITRNFSLRAHPRSRGEHLIQSVRRERRPGSSPLARGTPGAHLAVAFAFGLIPARAGNTGRSVGHTGYRRAHPRSRGEHVQSAGRRVPSPGSSPLARGTREGLVGGCSGVGLIPARAGNT